jgi:hypothetical protein
MRLTPDVKGVGCIRSPLLKKREVGHPQCFVLYCKELELYSGARCWPPARPPAEVDYDLDTFRWRLGPHIASARCVGHPAAL